VDLGGAASEVAIGVGVLDRDRQIVEAIVFRHQRVGRRGLHDRARRRIVVGAGSA
jgi:hypothetical protein